MTDREIMEALLRGETLEAECREMALDSNGAMQITDRSGLNWCCNTLSPAASWRIKPKPSLTWDQARKEMQLGKCARRQGWNTANSVHYGEKLALSGETYFLHGAYRGTYQGNIFNDSWLDATDWEVVE